MAYSGEYTEPELTYEQRVGQVVGTIMEAYTVTQAHIAKSERALNRVFAENTTIGAMNDALEINASDSDMAELRPEDASLAVHEAARQLAYGESAIAERALHAALTDYKQRIGGILLGSIVSVRISDIYHHLQRPGDRTSSRVPNQLTGRYTGYEPESSTLRLATDTDVYPVRLYMPDFKVPSKLVHAATITAIEFAA